MTNVSSRPDLTADEIEEIARECFGLSPANIKPLGGYVDQNFRIDPSDGPSRLLKIHSHAERNAVLDLQNQALLHLQANQQLDFAVPVPFQDINGNYIAEWESTDGKKERVRCLSYVEGDLLADYAPLNFETLSRAGQTIAALDNVLTDFEHPGAARPDLEWDLRNAPSIGQFVSDIRDPALRRMADYFFLQFELNTKPALQTLPLQISHNDGHRFSLLAKGSKANCNISGVIDFGDLVLTNAVCHLAVSISDLIVGQTNLSEAAASIVAGYHEQRPLLENEVDLIYNLVGVRLAMYATMAGRAIRKDPNNAHPQAKIADVKHLLCQLLEINPIAWTDALRNACGFSDRAKQREAESKYLVEKRSSLFSSSLYTHYEAPVVLENAAFQYMYDRDGRTYLDCVNNVCQWGHCHPIIVRAGQRQMARLNTNSRYVYEQMSNYAERLLATFPGPLDTVFFVNSGSEANDLAARLARAFTGHNDLIVVDRAYHGNSSLATDISPNRIDRPGRHGLPEHVRKTECPDLYRGKFRDDDPDALNKYLGDLTNVVRDMVAQGRSPAAFFAESLVGTGGQIVYPDGYLDGVYRSVRGAGGICIADEVQVGFGRTGNQMWCFEAQGVVPDIVTMGKPMGNGHPMAAVVTRREIAQAFDNGVTYFNTFGGNPVSCAIGLATLDVLENECLMENTVIMGARLKDGLIRLQKSHHQIGDVRGLGLYIGVEIVTDPTKRTPDARLAKQIIEAMKAKNILLNTNGYDNNIIKIKPPLIVDERDIDRILTTFGSVFADLCQKRTAA